VCPGPAAWCVCVRKQTRWAAGLCRFEGSCGRRSRGGLQHTQQASTRTRTGTSKHSAASTVHEAAGSSEPCAGTDAPQAARRTLVPQSKTILADRCHPDPIAERPLSVQVVEWRTGAGSHVSFLYQCTPSTTPVLHPREPPPWPPGRLPVARPTSLFVVSWSWMLLSDQKQPCL
jgi:hypothetical protein